MASLLRTPGALAGRCGRSLPAPPAGLVSSRPSGRRVEIRATQTVDLTGVVFQPFDEAKAELAIVNKTDASVQSLARVDFHPACEAALNEQINIEYNVSYVYHALYAYFNRDNVALPGMAAFFKAGSEEERDHAELLMDYQCKRGGQVVLGAISMPVLNVAGSDKGDALYAMELALSLEKLNFQKLRHLHSVADENGDASMADFIEGDLLAEQVDAVKAVSEYVSQLRRVGKGLGVYQFDKQLAAAVAAAPPA